MAQDVGRSSSDREITCTQVGIELLSPMGLHRTDWVRQHREKSWEVVGHRGWLVRAVSHQGGPGWLCWVRRLQGQWKESCGMGSAVLGEPRPAMSPGKEGKTAERGQVHCVTAVGKR